MSQPLPAPLPLPLTTVHRIAAQVTAEPHQTLSCTSALGWPFLTWPVTTEMSSPPFSSSLRCTSGLLSQDGSFDPKLLSFLLMMIFLYKTALLGCKLQITTCIYFSFAIQWLLLNYRIMQPAPHSNLTVFPSPARETSCSVQPLPVLTPVPRTANRLLSIRICFSLDIPDKWDRTWGLSSFT